MFSTTDTIVAIATPRGPGALGLIRISGPRAGEIGMSLAGRGRAFEPRSATLATVVAGSMRDRAVVTFFPGPASYTGDDSLEICAHGSTILLDAIVAAAVAAGARRAAPGEFTLRAFLNSKVDLPQAEAVADLIDAVTPLQAQAAFDQLSGTLSTKISEVHAELFDVMAKLEASIDFPDEGYHFIEPGAVTASVLRIASTIADILASARRGRLVREGAQVVIVGRPNVGKSSLFNALIGSHRAIVTDVPGTTRDMLTEVVDLRGLRLTLVDTAGIGDSDDEVEREGMARARQAATVADVAILVCDSEDAWSSSRHLLDTVKAGRSLLVASKADVPHPWCREDAVQVSTVTGLGLDRLVSAIHERLAGESLVDAPAVSNARHIDLLERARQSLERTAATIEESGGSLSEEFVLADLQDARHALEEVTGRRTSDDTLVHIFSRFCVGK